MVVQLLSNKEDAFENIRILWRDVIDTTGVNTVQELFQRFEKEKRRMLRRGSEGAFMEFGICGN